MDHFWADIEVGRMEVVSVHVAGRGNRRRDASPCGEDAVNVPMKAKGRHGSNRASLEVGSAVTVFGVLVDVTQRLLTFKE